MHRADLQRIAEEKLADAELLLAHGRFGNAYYLSGYAVEIAFKACIARRIAAETIPDKAFINSIYSHDLDKLAGVAGMISDLKSRRDKDTRFASNWTVVSEWSPEVRYGKIDKQAAEAMLGAVGSPDHGVFRWIKAYW